MLNFFGLKAGLFALITRNALSGLCGIFGLTAVVAMHEFGHFLFCKMFRIHTPTFSIGFGPQLLKKRIGGTDFVFSAIPLGGYVEIAGLAEMGQGEQKEAQRDDYLSFSQKPYWQKMLVMIGGIACNLLFAYAVLIFFYWHGFPKTELLYPYNGSTRIAHVHENTPAHSAHLKAGDRILAINDHAVHDSAMDFRRAIAPMADQEITLTIERDSQTIAVPVTLQAAPENSGKKLGVLGVDFEILELKSPTCLQAISDGIALTNTLIVGVFKAFISIFAKRDISSMGGPVQIISATVHGASKSFGVLLIILALISVNLAIFNLVPLPILDGGQMLYVTIEAIIRRPLPLKIREYIHMASWLFILALVLYLSAQDIYRLVKHWFVKA